MAAHLAGAFAANTTLPVVGIPMKGGAMDGLDALLATVQMPSGFPVATVALNGAKNAAVPGRGRSWPWLTTTLRRASWTEFRADTAAAIAKKDAAIARRGRRAVRKRLPPKVNAKDRYNTYFTI